MGKFSTTIIKKEPYEIKIRGFETELIRFIDSLGLPAENILVGIPERVKVFKNIESVLELISDEQRENSVYISKYISAVASGLFDAALNYLWDETILELRKRVAQYDLSYFFDNAVNNSEKRKRLKSEADLIKIDDSELIFGAKEIDLISEIGFKHLEYIRYMRNWISAAHPNQGEITGLQLIGWLETCIKEVISLPLSNIAIEIKKLLNDIREETISPEDAKEIGVFFTELTQDKVNNLVSGFFGIYTRPDSTTDSRNNIHNLLPLIWDLADEDLKNDLGRKYAKFAANNDKVEKKLARSFLDLVDGVQYIPDDLRVVELESAIDNLILAHRGGNNFYNEPPFARELERLVGNKSVPTQIRLKYVISLVEVFLTNGNGVAWYAEPIYEKLIRQLNNKEAVIAIISFRHTTIASRLQHPLCIKKYKEMIDSLKSNVSSKAALELIESIEKYKSPMESMKNDTRFKKMVDNIIKILKS